MSEDNDKEKRLNGKNKDIIKEKEDEKYHTVQLPYVVASNLQTFLSLASVSRKLAYEFGKLEDEEFSPELPSTLSTLKVRLQEALPKLPKHEIQHIFKEGVAGPLVTFKLNRMELDEIGEEVLKAEKKGKVSLEEVMETGEGGGNPEAIDTESFLLLNQSFVRAGGKDNPKLRLAIEARFYNQ